MSARVDGDNAIAFLEESYLVLEVRGVLAVAMQQDQRLSSSVLCIVQLDVQSITFDVKARLQPLCSTHCTPLQLVTVAPKSSLSTELE